MSGELVFDLYSLAVAHSTNETERQTRRFETLAKPTSAFIDATTCAQPTATLVRLCMLAG